MSNPLVTITSTELSCVVGGAAKKARIEGNPLAPVGSLPRCAYLKEDVQNRKDLVGADAVRGGIGGDQLQLAVRMFDEGYILGRDQREYRANSCADKLRAAGQ